VGPWCTAAVLYTARGAARVLAQLPAVTDAIDVMLPRLVGAGRLAAYHALPGVLLQDSFWGSDAGRARSCSFQVPH
jgi:hypothetical protein